MTSLWFDDDGRKLSIYDVVLVNDKYSTMIDEDHEGTRYLKGLPRDLKIVTIVRVDIEKGSE